MFARFARYTRYGIETPSALVALRASLNQDEDSSDGGFRMIWSAWVVQTRSGWLCAVDDVRSVLADSSRTGAVLVPEILARPVSSIRLS